MLPRRSDRSTKGISVPPFVPEPDSTKKARAALNRIDNEGSSSLIPDSSSPKMASPRKKRKKLGSASKSKKSKYKKKAIVKPIKKVPVESGEGTESDDSEKSDEAEKSDEGGVVNEPHLTTSAGGADENSFDGSEDDDNQSDEGNVTSVKEGSVKSGETKNLIKPEKLSSSKFSKFKLLCYVIILCCISYISETC